MTDKEPLVPTLNQPPPAYSSAPSAPPPGYNPPPVPPPSNQYGTATNVTVVTGYPQPTRGIVPPRPNTHLALAIIAFLFGFWPLALAAIFLSIRASSEYDAGHYDAAMVFARRARTYSIVALIVGVIVYVCSGIVLVVAFTV